MKKSLPEREQEMLDLIQSLKAQLVERGNVIHFLKRDIDAYLGALGYEVPGDHDGKLHDGTTPQCGMCHSEYQIQMNNRLLNIEADKFELERRIIKADSILFRFGYRHCDIPACNCNGYHHVTPYSETKTPKEPNQNEPVSTLETDGNRRPESTGPVVHCESPDKFSGAGGPQERTQLQTQSNPPADTHDSSGDSAVDTGATT